MFTPLEEAETSQMGGMVGERGDSDMEPGMASLSCGLPPCFSSFLNFDLLFWNQIFTCSGTGGHKEEGRENRDEPVRALQGVLRIFTHNKCRNIAEK